MDRTTEQGEYGTGPFRSFEAPETGNLGAELSVPARAHGCAHPAQAMLRPCQAALRLTKPHLKTLSRSGNGNGPWRG